MSIRGQFAISHASNQWPIGQEILKTYRFSLWSAPFRVHIVALRCSSRLFIVSVRSFLARSALIFGFFEQLICIFVSFLRNGRCFSLPIITTRERANLCRLLPFNFADTSQTPPFLLVLKIFGKLKLWVHMKLRRSVFSFWDTAVFWKEPHPLSYLKFIDTITVHYFLNCRILKGLRYLKRCSSPGKPNIVVDISHSIYSLA